MIAKRIRRDKGTSSAARLVRYMVGANGGLDPASWKRTADYILDTSSTTDKGEKVASFRVSNCGTEDPALATTMIEITQRRNSRSQADKTYHLVFSFPPGENPPLEVLHAIEDELVAAIGLEQHQRISAVHHDTDHLHVHIAINKVHPTGFQNVEPYYDQPKLMEACERLEVKYGLTRTNHGIEEGAENDRQQPGRRRGTRGRGKPERIHLGPEREHDTLFRQFLRQSYALTFAERPVAKSYADLRSMPGSGVAHPPRRYSELLPGNAHDRLHEERASSAGGVRRPRDGDRAVSGEPARSPASLKQFAHGMEIHAGVESLQGYVAREVAPAMREAASWAELHAALDAHGLQIKQRGAGLVIGDEGLGLWCRASSAGRDLAAKALTDRLGPFVPTPSVDQEANDGPDTATSTGPVAPRWQVVETRPGAKDTVLVLETDSSVAALQALRGNEFLWVRDARDQSHAAWTVWENDGATPVIKFSRAFQTHIEKERGPATNQNGSLGGGASPFGKAADPGIGDRRDRGYSPRPRQQHPSSKPLFEAYQRERAAAQAARRGGFVNVRATAAQQRAELKRWSALQRATIKATAKGPARKIALALLKQQTAARHEQIAKAAAQQRASLFGAGRLPPWNEWLAMRAQGGDAVALAVLRSREDRAEQMRGDLLSAEKAERARSIILKGLRPFVGKDGAVSYRTSDGGIVVDRSNHVQAKSATTGAALVALNLAAERFGGTPLDVRGTDQFRREVAQLAGIHGLKVSFADAKLEAIRKVSVTDAMAKQASGTRPTRERPTRAQGDNRGEATAAVHEWIEKRNSLRGKISSIDYNRLWTPSDAGPATYQGRRRMVDGTEVLLLKRGNEILVKPSTSNVVAKASTWKIGAAVRLDARGRFVTGDRGAEL